MTTWSGGCGRGGGGGGGIGPQQQLRHFHVPHHHAPQRGYPTATPTPMPPATPTSSATSTLRHSLFVVVAVVTVVRLMSRNLLFSPTASAPASTPAPIPTKWYSGCYSSLLLVMHQALATACLSPHGFIASPYRPRPLCSTLTNVMIASKASRMRDLAGVSNSGEGAVHEVSRRELLRECHHSLYFGQCDTSNLFGKGVARFGHGFKNLPNFLDGIKIAERQIRLIRVILGVKIVSGGDV